MLRTDTSTYHYKGRRGDQAVLSKRVREIAQTRVRYGYRRIHVLLRREGWRVNAKRVYRIYREQGLQLRNKVPKRRPKLSAKGIWERDGGHCQYTGRKLAPQEGNIDHVVPRSRGGVTSWENCVLADKRINSLKGNRLPEEVGLQLKKKPQTPRELPVSSFIRNAHNIEDWEHFLVSMK